jgi:hypothetical protein
MQLPLYLQIATLPLIIIYENFFEWAMHKYVLHGLGKSRSSFWSFHWIDHHSNTRRNNFYDTGYMPIKLTWNPQTKEMFSLALAALIHFPLYFISPLGYLVLALLGVAYFLIHRQSHVNPEWAKKYLSWHWDHHMGANQNLNWCVIWPLADWVLKTRVRYLKKES